MADPADRMAWLNDAPLFSDDSAVADLYAAVAPRDFKGGEVTLKVDRERLRDIRVKGGASGRLGAEADSGQLLSGLLGKLLPNLNLSGELKAGGEVEAQAKNHDRQELTVKLKPVDDPRRRLVGLCVHYLANYPERIFIGETDRLDTVIEGLDQDYVDAVPRSLTFIELHAGMRLMPMALEVEGGRVVTLYDRLVGSHRDAKLREERGSGTPAYWQALHQEADPQAAMGIIEQAVRDSGSRVQWIAYRVLDEAGRTIHLHLRADGRYQTGVFAYLIANRGAKHGLRVVGTAKSGPAINVLAAYER